MKIEEAKEVSHFKLKDETEGFSMDKDNNEWQLRSRGVDSAERKKQLDEMSESVYSYAPSNYTISQLRSPFGKARDDMSMLNKEIKAMNLPNAESKSNNSNNVSAEKQ